MGANYSTLPWDPFSHGQDRDYLRFKLFKHKLSGAALSPSTSHSSLTSNGSQWEPSSSSSSPSASTPSSALTSSILMGTNAPPLYEHALVGDWDALLRRIISHPKEARYHDKCHNTTLHVSCRRQPPSEVVAALIYAYPEAAQSRTIDGLTPLHFACYCGSEPPSVQQVLSQIPKSENLRDLVDRRGRTPLHCVCAGFRSPHRLEVIRLLLRKDPSCATATDERGRTPLSLIVDDYAEELQDALFGHISSEEIYQSCQTPGGDLYECWQVTVLLLRAAYRGTIEKDHTIAAEGEVNVDGEFQVLHAAVGVGVCPSVFVRLVLKVLPDSVREEDGDLNLPLHIALRVGAAGDPRRHPSTSCRNSNSRVVTRRSWNSVDGCTNSIASTGVVYNEDFGRSASFSNLKTLRLPSVSETTCSSQAASFFLQPQQDDVTVELLQAYPKAARVLDEFGKLPFLLAVESGKPWKILEPLYEAYPDGFSVAGELTDSLQKSIDNALTSTSFMLRNETVKTLRHMPSLWPPSGLNDWVLHLVNISRDFLTSSEDSFGSGGLSCHHFSSSPGLTKSLDHDESLRAIILSSILKGLASVLGNINEAQLMPETPRAALEMATPLLWHNKEEVRIGAAQVLGTSCGFFDQVSSEFVLRDIAFQSSCSDDEMSFVSTVASMITSGTEEEEEEETSKVEIVHGRAMACYSILLSHPQTLSHTQAKCVKEWMKHEDPMVRKAACLVVGAILAAPQNDHALKEFRPSILKCMRATEDVQVHIYLARGLSLAAKKHPKLFVCKTGLPILDGALMLSMTASWPVVHNGFQTFLWWALQVGAEDTCLHEYMKLAEGENGRIMMSLVTKTLTKMVHVEEDD